MNVKMGEAEKIRLLSTDEKRQRLKKYFLQRSMQELLMNVLRLVRLQLH